MNVAIPAKWRAIVYLVFSLLGLGLGGTAVGYQAAEVTQPTWLKVANAVFLFVGAGIGYTAASHTPDAPDAQRDGGYATLHLVLLVIGLVLIAVGLLGLLHILAIALSICILLVVIGLLMVIGAQYGGTLP